MNRKLNYVFSQVIDNYKTGFKENRSFYIGFGIFFLFLNMAGLFTVSLLDLIFFKGGGRLASNQTACVYIYISILGLPCLAILKQEKKKAMKFWETFFQNIEAIPVLGILAVAGFGFIAIYEELSQNTGILFYLEIEGLLEIIASMLTVVVLLYLLRIVTQKRIPFSELLLEALVLTIILFSLMKGTLNLYSYGLSLNSRGISGSLNLLIMTPIFFLIINMFIGPLSVLIITAMVGYEKTSEFKTETTRNEAL